MQMPVRLVSIVEQIAKNIRYQYSYCVTRIIFCSLITAKFILTVGAGADAGRLQVGQHLPDKV